MNGAASSTPIRPGISVNQLARSLTVWNSDSNSLMCIEQFVPLAAARHEPR